MATAKLSRAKLPSRKRGGKPDGRLWRRLALGLALVALAGLAASWPHLHALSRVAASYGAKVGCSCHYIDGRPLGDCPKDFEAGMGPVWLREDAATHTITARYAIIATERATWSAGPGCVLEPWKD